MSVDCDGWETAVNWRSKKARQRRWPHAFVVATSLTRPVIHSFCTATPPFGGDNAWRHQYSIPF